MRQVVSLPRLDGQRALPRGRQHLQRVENLGGLVEATEAGQPGAGEDDRVVHTLTDLADPGVHIAADVGDLQTEAEGVQLGGSTRRAGADPAACGELAEGQPVAGDDHVARVLAERYGGERDAGGRLGRQVLQRVHRDVDAVVQQRLAEGADEDSGAAELRPSAGRRGLPRW